MIGSVALSDPRRRPMLAKVHVAKKELGLDDETYRAVVKRVTGQASAAECGHDQLEHLLNDFRSKGWKPKARKPESPTAAPAAASSTARPADHAVAGKARALWISLHQLGVIRDPSERALEAFAKRQLKVECLQWADQSQGYRLIEALKAMALRHGWDAGGDSVHAIKVALVKAQWNRLSELGAIQGGRAPHCFGLAQWGASNRLVPSCRDVEQWPEPALEEAAQRLRGRIWKAQPTARGAA